MTEETMTTDGRARAAERAGDDERAAQERTRLGAATPEDTSLLQEAHASRVARGEEQADDEPVGRLNGAYRDLNARGRGEEWYRLRWTGREWSYLAQERLPAGRFLAADRKCSRKGDVYVGDVLVTHDLGKPLDTEAQLVVAPPAPGDTAPRRVECKITRLRDGRLSIALPRGEPLVTPDPRRK